jgi:hypothetical protein
MIRHVVMWKLKAQDAEGKSAAFTAIAEALGALPAAIPQIHSFHIGMDLGEREGNWDVVLVNDYKTAADLDTYQNHPAHVEAAAVPREHTTERAVVDYEF